MLQAVKDVSELDQLVDLLESIESFLKHLDIYTKSPQTAATTETLVKTFMELLSILGLATKLVKQRQLGGFLLLTLAFYPTQCNAGIFVERLLERNFDQMVLKRLDRLTLDEGRIAASQILKVVYVLVQNMRVIMDGEQTDWLATLSLRNSPFRR